MEKGRTGVTGVVGYCVVDAADKGVSGVDFIVVLNLYG